MRQLTAFASYLDNLGAPLVGRARFYNFDDSPAVVYGLDNAHQHYVQLGHIVYTNSSGQLMPQVFLADHDYLVVFDKYIGGGTMAEDDDPESWQEMGSAVDKYNTVGIELDGSAVRSFGTVDALRTAVPVESADGDEIVELLGYYETGDKPSIKYRWDPNSSEPDNGGSVIGTGAVGRWKLVECPEFLDVRHFGAFPNQASSEDVEQRYHIQLAGAYAHSNECGLYFSGTPLAVYYDITGLELYDIDSDDSASLFAIKNGNDDVMSVIRNVVDVKCETDQNTTFDDQGKIRLVGGALKTSFAPNYRAILEPSQRLIVDSGLRFSKSFENIIVECHEQLTNDGGLWHFTGCIIISNSSLAYAIANNCITLNGQLASIVLKTLTVNDTLTVRGNVQIGNEISIEDGHIALGNDYAIEWVDYDPESPTTVPTFRIRFNSTSELKSTDGMPEFTEMLSLPNGFQVDNDNFLMQPTGENEKYLSLKIKAVLDMTSKNGLPSGIKFDNIQVTNIAKARLLSTKIVSADEDGGSYSIRFDNGAYRNFFKVYTWDMSNSGSSYAFDLIPNFSTYDKFVLVVSWWWGSSNTKSEINQFVYLNGAGGKDVGEVICVENAGPRQHDYELSGLATNGDMKVFYDKSGNIFVLGARTDSDPAYVNKIIAVIPPFTSKNFILRDNGIWDPVEL